MQNSAFPSSFSDTVPPYTAFTGETHLASGGLPEVAQKAKTCLDQSREMEVMVFDNFTGKTVDMDFRGSADEVQEWVQAVYGARQAEAPEPRGPGRPKLGVVAREVTLLPRHWEWLATQRGGASAALRRLVEEARRANAGRDRQRQAQEACYQFMNTLAGDREGFEEATRALFAGDQARFEKLIKAWPKDIQAHASQLAAGAFA